MEKDEPEDILSRQLAICLTAMQEGLEKSRKVDPDDDCDRICTRQLNHIKELMHSSAALTLALARLRGETRHSIHVTREEPANAGDKG